MTTNASQLSGFRHLEAALRTAARHPLVLKRTSMYREDQQGELVRDVIALANVVAPGQRFIVLGAKCDVEAPARPEALTPADHLTGFTCARRASGCIEPGLRVDYLQWPMDGAHLGVLVIDGCENRPYLARCDVDANVRIGDGWIRSSQGTRRLTRRDLDRQFQMHLSESPFRGDVHVLFDTDPPSETLRLDATDLKDLPSRLAAERLTGLISAKEAIGSLQGVQHTYIGRLTHARLFGSDTPYIEKGLETLRGELADVAKQFAQYDLHFKYEVKAHRLNLRLRVSGNRELENVSLLVRLPAGAGLDLAPCVYRGEADEPENFSGGRYPTMDITPSEYRMCASFDSLSRDAELNAFELPVRVVVEEAALGFKFPLRYELRARNLRRPITGKLYIACRVQERKPTTRDETRA